MVSHVRVRGECRGDPPGSTEVMVGQIILANHYVSRHGRVTPTWRLRCKRNVGSEGLIDDESCPRERGM